MNQFDNLFFEQNSNYIDSELETMDPTIRFPNGIERSEDCIVQYEFKEESHGLLEIESWFRNILRKQWRQLEV